MSWFDDERKAGWWRSNPPEPVEPDRCEWCRYAVVVDSGTGHGHCLICVRTYEETACYEDMLMVHEDNTACEGFWEVE